MKLYQATILFCIISSSHGFSRAPFGHESPTRVSALNVMADKDQGIDRRSSFISIAAISAMFVQPIQPAMARLEAVDRPDLLPSAAGQNVIQTEKILTPGQAKRVDAMLSSLEMDTGFRVRVLCQKYPNTPGLAIRDYWDLAKEVRL